MTSRWPEADYVEDQRQPRPMPSAFSSPRTGKPDEPLRVVFIGTDFEIRVWETLLRIPIGRATSYSDIAAHLGKPSAARAVGTAVGRNPVSFVVPCHRVMGKSGEPVRLSLGLDPQARHPGLGSRHRRKSGLAITGAVPRPSCQRKLASPEAESRGSD